MLLCPRANSLARLPRPNLACDERAAEIELGLLPGVLGMKVRRLMLFVEHPDHNSKERRNDRHVKSIAPFSPSSPPNRRSNDPASSRGRLIVTPGAVGCKPILDGSPLLVTGIQGLNERFNRSIHFTRELRHIHVHRTVASFYFGDLS